MRKSVFGTKHHQHHICLFLVRGGSWPLKKWLQSMGNTGSLDSHCPGGVWTGRMTAVLCGPQSPRLSQEAEWLFHKLESKCCPSCERQNHHLLPPSQLMPVTLPDKADRLPSEKCVQHCSYSAPFPPKSSFAVSSRSPVANTSHRNRSKSKTLCI